MRFFLLILAAGLLNIGVALAQKEPIKFGKIDMSDLEMKFYSKDSSANAVVLCDYGNSYINYGTDGFQVVFEKHIRIKILNKAGYDWATASVEVYHEGSNKEKAVDLKAATYNLVKGKIVKTKMEKSAIFEEKINDNWDAVKFTLPNVKEGSVIEYSYKIMSDYLFNYRDWQFQTTIPVIWSEYRAKFIQYYTYQKLFKGYVPFVINESSKVTQNIVLKSHATTIAGSGGMPQRTGGGISNVRASGVLNRWVAKDVPAFVSEPFMNSSKNYISEVSFELESSKFPNRAPVRYTYSWQTLNYNLLTDDFFGLMVGGSNFLNKQVEELIVGLNTDEEKIRAIYHYVKSNVKWNGKYRKFLTTNFKTTLNNKKGSSAEINLLLVSMLQKAGFVTDPVIISTRDNGMIRQNVAALNQFNYVIGAIQLNGRIILLDATDAYLPIGMLPERCLNGIGWRVSESNSGWINLNPQFKRVSQVNANLNVSASGNISGNLDIKKDGYSARDSRVDYYIQGKDKYSTEVVAKSNWEIANHTVDKGENLSEPFIDKYEFATSQNLEKAGDILYLSPMLVKDFETNPFKLKRREYPVDFACPISSLYYVTFNIPEGYKVDEVPGPTAIVLPDGGGKYVYNITVQGDKIVVMSKMDIEKTLFLPQEYDYLRAFLSEVIAKQKEQVVLKKI